MQKSRFDKQCAVLGIGNVILGDEGIGVHLVKRLRRKYHFTPEVAIIDGGCGGLSLYFVFEQYDPVIIIDALTPTAGTPGSIHLLSGKTLQREQGNGCSGHHVGLRDVLMLLSMLSSAPKDILLIGVVSERIEFGEGLSTTLEQQIQRVEETVIKQLNFRNIEVLQQ